MIVLLKQLIESNVEICLENMVNFCAQNKCASLVEFGGNTEKWAQIVQSRLGMPGMPVAVSRISRCDI